MKQMRGIPLISEWFVSGLLQSKKNFYMPDKKIPSLIVYYKSNAN